MEKAHKLLYRIRSLLRRHLIYYRTLGLIRRIHRRRGGGTKALRAYYSHTVLHLPKDPQWRSFRFFLADGRVIRIRDRIRDADDLRRYLLRYCPAEAVYSGALWLDPRRIGPYSKERNLSENGIFLSSDLIFDVDATDLEDARKAALSLIALMEGRGHPLEWIRFTGSKGFHLCFGAGNHARSISSIADPRERERQSVRMRKDILAQIAGARKDILPFIDERSFLNTRGFFRLEGTVNALTGRVCRRITREELADGMARILEGTMTVKDMPRASMHGDEPARMRDLRLELDRHGQTQVHDYDAYFVSNIVTGLSDRYVPILRYRNRTLLEVAADVRGLQSRFFLSDFQLFRTDTKDEYYAVCLQTVPGDTLAKIMEGSAAVRRGSVGHDRVVYMRISGKLGASGEGLGKAPEFVLTVKSHAEGVLLSRPHALLFAGYSKKLRKYAKAPRLHGSPKPLIYLARIREGRLEGKMPAPDFTPEGRG